jgi:hypothetical protein
MIFPMIDVPCWSNSWAGWPVTPGSGESRPSASSSAYVFFGPTLILPCSLRLSPFAVNTPLELAAASYFGRRRPCSESMKFSLGGTYA